MAKSFIVRLKCPYGDEDGWLVLQNREEPLVQILETAWDFECPVHGVQKEIPIIGNEKGRLAGARRSTQARAAETISTQAKPRSSPRISIHIPVMVYGWSHNEISFHEEATTLLVNASGGLKSKGHPVGATGVGQICDIAEQIRGQAGERQVKRNSLGLAQNLGGSGATSVITILGAA